MEAINQEPITEKEDTINQRKAKGGKENTF